MNIILQKLNYTIYFAVLTRTSANHYHVLSKQKISVFSSPSQHSVLYKERMEEYSYPMINFHVDNYEEVSSLLVSLFQVLLISGLFSFYLKIFSITLKLFILNFWFPSHQRKNHQCYYHSLLTTNPSIMPIVKRYFFCKIIFFR